jgi:hypothetical protein
MRGGLKWQKFSLLLRTSSSCRLSCALLLSLVLDHHHRETKVAVEMISFVMVI